MKKNFTILLFTVVVFSLLDIKTNAQEDCNTTIILDYPHNLSQSYPYEASKLIKMIPAFSYFPGPGNQLKAHINPDLLCPITYEINPVDPEKRPLDYSLPVGATSGSFSLGPAGSANYTIPIILPPGTAGLNPEIALVYNSQAGNGLLGIGWNLAAGSSIKRIPKNLYSTQTVSANNVISLGYNKGITLIDDDFAIDGSRLYAVNGLSYGDDGCEYYTELFNGSKIISYGQDLNGPVWFHVKTKDGKVIEYGRSEDSRVKSSTSEEILYWNINKITDLKGNYIEFKYIVHKPPQYSEIQFYLSEINYTGNASQELTPYNSVKFTYSSRQDQSFSYIYGTKFKQNILLDKIVTYAGNNIVRRYDFSYTFDFFSHLYEIKEFGSDGNRYNSTVCKYTTQHNSTDFKELLGTTVIPENTDRQYWYHTLDFNGDGRSDILQCEYIKLGYKLYYSWNVYENTSLDNHFDGISNFQLYHTENINCDEITYGDSNGDGLDDIFVIQKYGDSFKLICYYSRPNDPDKFIPVELGFINGVTEIANIRPVEINGDGKTDLMLINETSVGNFETHLLISNNVSPDPLITLYYTECITGIYAANDDKINLGDFNGDGKNEILIQDKNANNFKVYNYDNTTNGVTLQFSGTEIGAYDSVAVANFNGDSYADLLVYRDYNSTWHIWYSDGTRFIDEGTSPAALVADPRNNDNSFLIGDFNGDGLSDIYQAISNSSNNYTAITIFYSHGNDFTTSTAEINEHLAYWEVRYTIGDFNGDGNTDILSYDFPNPQNTLQERRLKAIILNEKVKPHHLVSIANGLNHLTKFEYHPLTNEKYYERGVNFLGFINTFGQVSDCQPPLYVLTMISSSSGVNNALISSGYSYKGARFHRLGKGFLGYTQLSQYDHEKDITTRKTFEVHFENSDISLNEFCTNSLIESTVTVGSTLVSKETYTNHYKLKIYPNDHYCRVFFPINNKTISDDLLTNVTTTTEVNDNDMDNFGNVLKSKISYGNEGYKEISSTYTDVDGQIYWCPSQPDEVTTTLMRTNDVAYTRKVHYIYYGESGGGISGDEDPDNIGLLRSVICDPGKPKMMMTIFEYDAYGNIRLKINNTIKLPNRTTSFTYDSKGRFPITETNSLDHVVKSTYDDRTGNPLTITDQNNLTTVYQYDGFGRQTKVTTPDNVSSINNVQWVTNNQPANALFKITKDTDGEPISISYNDILCRPVRSLQGSFRDRNVVVDSKYNLKGQQIEITEPYYEGDPSPSASGKTTYQYNSEGRIDRIIHPAFTEKYDYSGNTIMVTNLSTGQFLLSVKDSWNSTKQVMDPAGTVVYTYYSSGLPKEITGVDQTKTTMLYDDYGRQISLNDPDAGEHHYEYDAYGSLMWEEDPKGNRFTYTYDLLDRLITKTGTDNTSITYTYDNEPTGIGLLSSISYSNGIIYHEQYDALSRLNKHTERIDGVDYLTTFDFDMYGNVSKIEYPSQVVVRNEYEDGYLSNVYLNGNNTPIFSTNHFNQRGQITNYALGNGYVVTRGYDGFGFPSLIRVGSILDQSYFFDPPSGNLTSHTDNLRGLSESYNYTDALKNRLNEHLVAGQSAANTISYAPNGNIESKSDIGAYFHYDPAFCPPHAVYKVTSAMGPHTNENLQTITYTSFNKIEQLSHQTNGYNLLFTYGPDYSRKKTELFKNSELIKTKLFIGGGYEIEKTANGTTRQLHYINGADGLAAIYVIENGPGTMYYIHKDYLGSWQSVTDESGNIVQEMSYDPWGRRRSPIDWTFDNLPGSFLFDRGFTGHEHLKEFDLINMNGRTYDPLIARFLTPDNFIQSSSNSQNFNRYSYCFNNPLIYTDPSGEIALIDDAILGLIGGTINVLTNLGNIHSLGQGLGYFGIGFVSGVLSEYITPVGAAALMGAGNAALGSYVSTGHVDPGAVIHGAVTSGIVSGLTMGLGQAIAPSLSNVFSGIASPVLRNAITQGVIGTGLGAIGGGLGSVMNGGNFWEGAGQGALWGGGIGFATGVYGGFQYAKARDLNPWTGRSTLGPLTPLKPIEGYVSPYQKGQEGVNRAIDEINAQGGRVLRQEITVEVNGIRVRVDIAADFNGEIILYEVKNGPSAGFTPNQKIVLPQMQDGIPIIPRGGNANYVWPGQVGQPTTQYYLIIKKY